MRFYLAARYSRLSEMQKVRLQLQELGHCVTSRWVNGDHQALDNGVTLAASDIAARRFAEEDLEDIHGADAIVAFTERPRSQHSRGGRHVELGYALALDKHILVIGPRENVFCCLPGVISFPDTRTFLRAVTNIRSFFNAS